jgi:hypothetical protein
VGVGWWGFKPAHSLDERAFLLDFVKNRSVSYEGSVGMFKPGLLVREESISLGPTWPSNQYTLQRQFQAQLNGESPREQKKSVCDGSRFAVEQDEDRRGKYYWLDVMARLLVHLPVLKCACWSNRRLDLVTLVETSLEWERKMVRDFGYATSHSN